ncbi:MAG: NAD-dependent malic enzyme [Pseudohongiellaceae bacterium]
MSTMSAPPQEFLSINFIVRLKLVNKIGSLADVTRAIADAGGDLGAVDLVRSTGDETIRDFSVVTENAETSKGVLDAVRSLEVAEFIHYSDRTFLIHLGGKIEIANKASLKSRDDLSMVYTPGVARVCMSIHQNPQAALNLTIKKNTVAVVSDGTAVLGLGDIGPLAAMPVMEGKAMLFKHFGEVDAFPICLDTKETDEIVAAIKAVAPTFGGINLEDISAPRCFEIEQRLQEELDIPVFHDDQHGTAVVSTAALINSLKVVGKKPEDLKMVVMGAGAAGTACSKMAMLLGVKNIVGCDRRGAIYKGRDGLNHAKQWFAENTNPDKERGTLSDIIKGADVFIGVSAPGVLTVDDLKQMARDPIVFAMANPTPEIMPDIAMPHVGVMATGRSDYQNQINNVLCFPGIFRGALDCQASDITENMKMAAAEAIATTIEDALLQPDYVVPSVFDANVVPAVARAVANAAHADGVARRGAIEDDEDEDFQA